MTEAYADRLKRVLEDLETHVSGQSDSTINYAAARDPRNHLRRRPRRAPCNGSCTGG